jgi:hypothetical protein
MSVKGRIRLSDMYTATCGMYGLSSEALLSFEVLGVNFQNCAQKSAHPAALDAIIVVNIVGTVVLTSVTSVHILWIWL